MNSSPVAGYGIAVGIIVGVSFLLGAVAYVRVQGDAANYFVAGHSLPWWMVAIVRTIEIISHLFCLVTP